MACTPDVPSCGPPVSQLNRSGPSQLRMVWAQVMSHAEAVSPVPLEVRPSLLGPEQLSFAGRLGTRWNK